MEDGVIKFVHPDGRVLVCTPVPGDPFKFTTRFEDDGTTVVDAIEKAFKEGKCRNEK